MPTFPSFDLSDLDLSKLDVDRLAGAVRDTAYVGVGLTVLAVQRAQVARREVTALVERQASRLRDLIPA